MDPAQTAPLSVRNYTEINRALGLLNELEQACERAEKAGFDTTEVQLGCQYYRTLFNKIKAEYFRDKP